MIHNFALKPKEEMANSKNLLLVMVRLIHVDPMLMLHVRCLHKYKIIEQGAMKSINYVRNINLLIINIILNMQKNIYIHI